MSQTEQQNNIILGWREWVALPALGIHAVKAKIDTGARTSALHVFALEPYEWEGKQRVRFGIHPVQKRTHIEVLCDTDVVDKRWVMDSGGHREERFVIVAPVCIAGREWPIEITLTNRENMLFRMLLGRTALCNGVLVHPQQSYLAGKALRRVYTRKKT